MSKQKPEQTQENLRKLLQQHWDHCRHLERERLQFMLSYAILIGTISVGSVSIFIIIIIGSGGEDLANVVADLLRSGNLLSLFFKFLITFLIWFTFLGFFLTQRWTYAFERHRERVNYLVKLMKPRSRYKIAWEKLDMEIPPMELLPSPRKIWESVKKLKEFGQVFRTRYLFPALYFVVLILCAIVFPPPFRWVATGCLVFAFWLGIVFFCSEPPKPSKPLKPPEPSKPK